MVDGSTKDMLALGLRLYLHGTGKCMVDGSTQERLGLGLRLYLGLVNIWLMDLPNTG